MLLFGLVFVLFYIRLSGSKSYIVIVFLKIWFRAYTNFIYFPHDPMDIIGGFFFFDFRFSSRKSQSDQRLVKKTTHITIQFRSKNFTQFTNLNSLDIENNILMKHSQKLFSLDRFSSKHVSVWCQKKDICTALFLDAQELHSWSTLKGNICIFLYISVRKFYLVGEDSIVSLTRLTVWAA